MVQAQTHQPAWPETNPIHTVTPEASFSSIEVAQQGRHVKSHYETRNYLAKAPKFH